MTLIKFFNQEGFKGLQSLLSVPGTAFGTPKFCDNIKKFFKVHRLSISDLAANISVSLSYSKSVNIVNLIVILTMLLANMAYIGKTRFFNPLIFLNFPIGTLVAF